MTTESVGQPARSHRRRRSLPLAVVTVLALAACGGTNGAAAPSGNLTLYTCVSDETVQPVITAFQKSTPGSHVNLFRAPTGQLNARVAADTRSGGLRADVIWGCDPLTIQAFVDQGLVGGWTPSDADGIPREYRTDDYVGAAVLYMVAVHRTDVPAPRAWSDLAGPHYAGAVAVPDPSVAASALGALGWFAEDPAYGTGFYRSLRTNGAVQVSTPDDVTTGVAQGIYDVGMTTANAAYAAQRNGSPVGVVWPEPGAVSIYGPVALARHSAASQVAENFISFLVGADGQAVLGAAGSYPTRPGVAGPTVPAGAPIVSPDWGAIERTKDGILRDYQQIFGG
ncbi:MAG: transporter substrate-binding protein [Modestobacter sp.]|jgi:iron(III) transport system substrate-binding protein|nr:transporter substrate-binding protein [Modestobacter sp.]